jgi:hypothetical protein
MKSIEELQKTFLDESQRRAEIRARISQNKLKNAQIKNQAEIDVHLSEDYAHLKNADQRNAQVKAIMTTSGYFDNEAAIIIDEESVDLADAIIRVHAWDIQAIVNAKGGAN